MTTVAWKIISSPENRGHFFEGNFMIRKKHKTLKIFFSNALRVRTVTQGEWHSGLNR